LKYKKTLKPPDLSRIGEKGVALSKEQNRIFKTNKITKKRKTL